MAHPHGDVARSVVEGLSGVYSPGPPASDYYGGVSIDADIVLVAMSVLPAAVPGPHGNEDGLPVQDLPSVTYVEAIRCHEAIESIHVEPEVGDQPFVLRPEDLPLRPDLSVYPQDASL